MKPNNECRPLVKVKTKNVEIHHLMFILLSQCGVIHKMLYLPAIDIKNYQNTFDMWFQFVPKLATLTHFWGRSLAKRLVYSTSFLDWMMIMPITLILISSREGRDQSGLRGLISHTELLRIHIVPHLRPSDHDDVHSQ